jgi:Short C-terminal domain/Phospholipase_D-nuclease N-terminal
MGFQIDTGALGFLGFFFLILIWIAFFLTWAFSLWDIFFRRSLGGLAKAGWFVLVIVVPFIGTIIYLIARPKPEPEEAKWAPRVEGSSSPGQELERLAQLKEDGHLSAEEYERQKAKLLAQ